MNYYSRIYSILSEAKKLTDYDPFGATWDQQLAYKDLRQSKGKLKKIGVNLEKFYGGNKDFATKKNVKDRSRINAAYLDRAKQHGQNIKNLQAQGVKVHNLKTRSPLSGATKGLARGVNFVRDIFK